MKDYEKIIKILGLKYGILFWIKFYVRISFHSTIYTLYDISKIYRSIKDKIILWLKSIFNGKRFRNKLIYFQNI